jgi:dynein heavy chain
MEMHFNNMWYMDLNTREWHDCDLLYDVPRWNHSGVLVEAIPTWKYFIFGGEANEYSEGVARTFGAYINTSCYLDCGTLNWTQYASDPDVFSNIPSPREYAAMCYDGRDRRLIVYGGWNNGWYDDIYALCVSKIVGPPYAITGSEPNMGQLSGGVKLVITGRGFKDYNIQVLFTCGNKPIDTVGKMTKSVTGTYHSPTEISCITPDFVDFGPKEAVMQITIGTEDITTTSIPFTYFMNTRAAKSLCYGPGILDGAVIGQPVEFVIQARNDDGNNRSSGRDVFEVKITKRRAIVVEVAPPVEGEEEEEKKEEPLLDEEGNPIVKEVKPQFEDVPIDCEVIDTQDGKYTVKYQNDEPGEVKINVEFLDDKGQMVYVRGSPYKANFVEAGKAIDNTMTGALLDKHIKKELERLQGNMTESKKEITTKDKDLKNVKALLKIKENVEKTQKCTDEITLEIDQLDEAIKLFTSKKLVKEGPGKAFEKINKGWNELKKLTKDVSKEIASHVSQENDRNNMNIKKLEESITQFTQDMKKREFFQYNCGTEKAKEKLDGVFEELKEFEDKIADFGDNAFKFGKPELINKAVKDIEGIKILVGNMKHLWDHIKDCQDAFARFMATKWIETKPFEMEDEVKKL